MEASLMLLFMGLQLTLGLAFLIWLWVVRIRNTRRHPASKGERSLFSAVVFFTAAVAGNFYFMFAPRITHHKWLAFLIFGLACLSVVFSLFGKGKGRVLTTVAACGLALSWLPFILS